jgi:hypothetical protein
MPFYPTETHGAGFVSLEQAFYRGAWVQGQYRPVRAGVSCAAVRCGVHVLSTHRDMVAD